MATTEALRKQISQSMPEIIDELTELVAIPSVAFAGHDLAQVRRSAEHVAGLFEQLGGSEMRVETQLNMAQGGMNRILEDEENSLAEDNRSDD